MTRKYTLTMFAAKGAETTLEELQRKYPQYEFNAGPASDDAGPVDAITMLAPDGAAYIVAIAEGATTHEKGITMSDFPIGIPWGMQTEEQRHCVLAWRDEQRRQEEAARNADSGGFTQAQLCAILNGKDAGYVPVGQLFPPNEHSVIPSVFCFTDGVQFWQANATPDRNVTGERIVHRFDVRGPLALPAIVGSHSAW